MFKEDLYARCIHTYGSVNVKNILRAMLSPGASSVFLFRLSDFFHKNHLGIVGMIISNFNYHWNSILIGRGAIIGKGFVVTHSIGVVINGNVTIGNNLIIEHGVTIGSKGRSLPNPIISNNVYIGAGAKIIGPVSIGNNSKVGTNAVVVKDIPDNVTVVGIPARIIGKT